ncbi:type II toxin-antitoxin system HicB family antitoxin [Dermatophilus congolensis]|uniref:type II toxin-antitoxin system HicB family antitoxin n=1 Tax=Dermatophilus congolensis TaxID=1863 RepID=UPI001AAE4133|nr:type II toxin-antitoxin system HicB family antitoxin [Dermatophilus congolensis]MBO3146357.1 type II toxin-antitoxin system HicB family antitoxin [Dermatophilus congolensis]MBO3148600.1 type II toxin-antitoxin system HicB family antitoxin [Dermatophilus congolensis]MBO3157594.1 type II toxin-antitoxin system HicB family antitoxin [Dermatophilus congolensis]MBO3159874.1 type II toxin-antitoxin system HicB family antitoxin [Dermatophilus congolensis]MBO3166613.1 type II toxin-antitoxin system
MNLKCDPQSRVDTSHYAFRVTWSQDDQEHVATCVEFPSLSWLAPTPEEALAGLQTVINDVVEDMYQSGEEVPEPISTRHFSGTFTLRPGRDLHRRMALAAAEQKVSLQQFAVRTLAAGVQ